MSKRPLGHGDLRNMGNFKAAAADYAYYLTLSDEGRLYCLSDRQIYVLLVQLDYVGWLTRWYNTADITQTTVGFIRSELEEALLSCVDVSILVDQANENLITQVVNQQIQSQILRDALEDRYDGTPTSINPDAPVTNFGAAGDRFTALCAGLTAFVYQFARIQLDQVRAGQVGGLAAVGLAAGLLIPGLNIFFLVGASLAVLIGLGTIGVTTQVAINALGDKDALNDVICCMMENLSYKSVSEANWATALGGCGFESGSNQQIIADFLGSQLATNYLTALNMLGQSYGSLLAGDTLPACPACVEPPDPACKDFRISQYDWVPVGGNGVYHLGGGLGPLNVPPNWVIWWQMTKPMVLLGPFYRIKVKFNMAIANVLISANNQLYNSGATAKSEVLIGEADMPAMFPFSYFSAAPSFAVRIQTGSGLINVPSGLRIVEICMYTTP